jgi:hypothetical protein
MPDYGLKGTIPIGGIPTDTINVLQMPKVGVPFGDTRTAPMEIGTVGSGLLDMSNQDFNSFLMSGLNLDGSNSNSFWDPKNWGMNGFGGFAIGAGQLGLGLYNSINGMKIAKENARRADEMLAMAKAQYNDNRGITLENYNDKLVARAANNEGLYGSDARAYALSRLNELEKSMDKGSASA